MLTSHRTRSPIAKPHWLGRLARPGEQAHVHVPYSIVQSDGIPSSTSLVPHSWLQSKTANHQPFGRIQDLSTNEHAARQQDEPTRTGLSLSEDFNIISKILLFKTIYVVHRYVFNTCLSYCLIRMLIAWREKVPWKISQHPSYRNGTRWFRCIHRCFYRKNRNRKSQKTAATSTSVEMAQDDKQKIFHGQKMQNSCAFSADGSEAKCHWNLTKIFLSPAGKKFSRIFITKFAEINL